MTPLQTAIAQLYGVFGAYTTAGMHHCDCGCIRSEDVEKLLARPLQQLQDGDLAPYQGSALYTWGDVEHYKHFLPRIMELYVADRKGLIDLDEIASKLDYAQWKTWPPEEVKAIEDFIWADWVEFVNRCDAGLSKWELEAYTRFYPIETLLPQWKITGSGAALRKFVGFFYEYGNALLENGTKPHVPAYAVALGRLMYTEGLLQSLQEAFFRFEKEEPDYAEKVSVVLQMIEQQLKAEQSIKDPDV